MSDWIPPYYNKLGTKVNDLFKKKFEIKNELKTINKSANGVELESSFGGETSVNGKVKGKYKKPDYEFEGEFQTEGDVNLTGKAKGLVDGLEISLSCLAKKQKVGVTAKYCQPFYSTVFNASHVKKNNKTLMDGSFMIGFDGLSVGVKGEIDVRSDDILTDYNCGAEYTQDDLTVSLFTEKKASVITASYWQKISRDCNLGVSLRMDPDDDQGGEHVLTVGSDYQLDSATNVAFKGNTAGVLQANVEHVLNNPCLKLGIGASFDSTKTTNVLAADKFGISCTFGDF